MRHVFSHIIFLTSVFLFLSQVGCEKKSTSILDTQGSAPQILSAVISPSTINTDTMNIGVTRQPDDVLDLKIYIQSKIISQSGSSIGQVSYSISDNANGIIQSEGILLDNGSAPDQIAGDSIYSAYADFSIQRSWIGYFTVGIYAIDSHDYQSNTRLINLQIQRNNHPPVISNLLMDSLISLSSLEEDTLRQIRIKAADPDGLSDILKVYFNSFKPNGAASSGNPFLMYDDGNSSLNHRSGDVLSGDGIFGLIFVIPRSTPVGTYRFEFHAVDRSLDSSNVITHEIVITQ